VRQAALINPVAKLHPSIVAVNYASRLTSNWPCPYKAAPFTGAPSQEQYEPEFPRYLGCDRRADRALRGALWLPAVQRLQRLQGEAELARAESNRQVAVREAQAKKDAASLLAEAEIARTKGVAEANHIIGASLKDNEAYLRYLWIDKMEGAKAQVIYVPTETGLPILEASRKPGAP
jgi:hypothetical protein